MICHYCDNELHGGEITEYPQGVCDTCYLSNNTTVTKSNITITLTEDQLAIIISMMNIGIAQIPDKGFYKNTVALAKRTVTKLSKQRA